MQQSLHQQHNCVYPTIVVFGLNYIKMSILFDRSTFKLATHFLKRISRGNLMSLYFFIFFYLTSPQGQGHHNSVSQLLWPRITYPPCQLSLWEETGVPGENPRLSAERWLYSFHMRTGFESTLRWTLLGIELGTSEVKGEWSDHYTTEAPYLSCYIS